MAQHEDMLWYGESIRNMDKEKLIEVILEMAKYMENTRENHQKDIKTLFEFI